MYCDRGAVPRLSDVDMKTFQQRITWCITEHSRGWIFSWCAFAAANCDPAGPGAPFARARGCATAHRPKQPLAGTIITHELNSLRSSNQCFVLVRRLRHVVVAAAVRRPAVVGGVERSLLLVRQPWRVHPIVLTCSKTRAENVQCSCEFCSGKSKQASLRHFTLCAHTRY